MSSQTRRHRDTLGFLPGRRRSFRAAVSIRLLLPLFGLSVLTVLGFVYLPTWFEPETGRNVGDRSIRDWAASLGDSDSKLRNQAVEVLIAVGHEAAPFLYGALEDRNVQRRRDAVLVLQKIRPEDSASAQALADALYDSDRWVRLRAAQSLRNMGPAAKDAVLPLATLLSDPDPVVRLTAAQALGEIGKLAVLAHPALLQAMQDERVFVRRAATAAMVKVMPGIDSKHGLDTDPLVKFEY